VSRWRRFILGRRSRRVTLMLALLWIVGLFDLVFTILAHRIGGFHEANPVARPLIGDDSALALYKLGLLVLSTAILFVLRRHLVTEITCWMLGAIYAGLALMWLAYFGILG
jgi:hypothetical protein